MKLRSTAIATALFLIQVVQPIFIPTAFGKLTIEGVSLAPKFN